MTLSDPKGTKTEWNIGPLTILKKLNFCPETYDFKKDRKNIFYDEILNSLSFQGGQEAK